MDRVNRAISYSETDQCSLAIQDSQRALEMEHVVSAAYHTDAEAQAILVVCNHINENYQGAIEHADKALKLMNSTGYPAEELAVIHVVAGTSHHLSGNYPEAIRHLSNAITLNDNADARSTRAWTYWNTGDCTSAIEDSLQAIAMLPVTAPSYHTAAEGHLILYYCYSDQGKWSEALQNTEAALILMHAHDYDPESIALVENDVLSLRWSTSQ